MKRKTYFAICVLLCALSIALCIVLSGCSQTDNGVDGPDSPDVPSGVEVPVRITLSALPNNGTRGDGDPKDPVASVELIHDWWIAFVASKTGDVKVVKRDDVAEEDRTTSTSVDIDGGGFEAETFRTTLPAGTYRIYAFANITAMDAKTFKDKILKETTNEDDKWQHKTINLDRFIEKNRLSNQKGDSMLWHPKYIDNNKEVDNNIPMSAVMKNIKIKNTVENAFNVEVIRAVAKVEFAFSNPYNYDISLNTLKFDPISNRPCKISIIPNYDAVGKGPNEKLFENISKAGKDDDGRPSTGTLTFSSNSNLSLTPDASNKYSMGLFSFYCMESIPKTDKGGPFTIKLEVTRDGENKEYSYETKKITYINRNDWVRIPITFTDWLIRWRMHYYPPIAGYPPLFEQSNDGTDVYLVATTPGEFEIFPDITYLGNGGTKIDYNWFQGGKDTWNHEPNDDDPTNYVSIEVTEGENLFEKAPTKQTDPGSIGDKQRYYFSGVFNNVEGTATVVVTFKLAEGPYANQEKTCTFHITRQNSSQ